MPELKEITTHQEFTAEIERGSNPSFLIFTAEWCPASRAIRASIVDLFKGDENLDLNFFGIDVEKNPLTPTKLGVSAVPSFVILNSKGDLIWQQKGAVLNSQLQYFIKMHTSKN